MVRVAEGVTLTIDPGVVVNGLSNYPIEVWGTLEAIGSQTENIVFNNVWIRVQSENALIN